MGEVWRERHPHLALSSFSEEDQVDTGPGFAQALALQSCLVKVDRRRRAAKTVGSAIEATDTTPLQLSAGLRHAG
jgi:hypothetical protein